MLQIITEKFFKPGERYTTLHRAIFYTNYRMMRGEKMQSPIAVLLPSTGLHALATLTCEMTEQQEKYPDGSKRSIFIALNMLCFASRPPSASAPSRCSSV